MPDITQIVASQRTGDFAMFLNGVLVGFAPTRRAAERHLKVLIAQSPAAPPLKERTR